MSTKLSTMLSGDLHDFFVNSIAKLILIPYQFYSEIPKMVGKISKEIFQLAVKISHNSMFVQKNNLVLRLNIHIIDISDFEISLLINLNKIAKNKLEYIH